MFFTAAFLHCFMSNLARHCNNQLCNFNKVYYRMEGYALCENLKLTLLKSNVYFIKYRMST